MKKLNSYIFEKLHLSKDNKNLINDSDVNTVVSIMTNICCLNLDQSMIKDILKSFEDWVKKNKINSIDEVECLASKEYVDKHIWNYIQTKGLSKFIKEVHFDTIKEYYGKYIVTVDWKKYLKATMPDERNDLGSTYETDKGDFIYFTNYVGVTIFVFRKKER